VLGEVGGVFRSRAGTSSRLIGRLRRCWLDSLSLLDFISNHETTLGRLECHAFTPAATGAGADADADADAENTTNNCEGLTVCVKAQKNAHPISNPGGCTLESLNNRDFTQN
jgi:hypothetical protein